MTFSGFNIGTTGVQTAQRALDVIGHNVANASRENFTRQRAVINAAPGLDMGYGVIGQGVNARSVMRVADEFINQSLRDAESNLSENKQLADVYGQLESIFNELTDTDLTSTLQEFWNAAEQLSVRPDSLTARNAFLQQADATAQLFNELSTKLSSYRENLDQQLSSTVVSNANNLLKNIADLNVQIVSLERAGTAGYEANDLRDERDGKLRELAQLMKIDVIPQNNGSVTVSVNNQYLVSYERFNELTAVPKFVDERTRHEILLHETGVTVAFTGGGLAGIIEARDNIIPSFEDVLDDLASNFLYQVNHIMSQGVGLQQLQSATSVNNVTDANLALNSPNLSFGFTARANTFVPKNGSFNIEVVDNITGAVTSTNIKVDLDGIGGNDTTLNTLRTALDGVANINATVDAQKHLVIQADSAAHSFYFSQDTSEILATLGINTLFKGHDAGTIAINPAMGNSPELVPAGLSLNPSDNTNILDLLALREETLMNNSSTNMEDYYQSSISELGVQSNKADTSHATAEAVMTSVETQREEVSGVSLDEEMTSMIKFQRTYQASARFITTLNSVMDALMNM